MTRAGTPVRRTPQSDGERKILSRLEALAAYRADSPAAYMLEHGFFHAPQELSAEQRSYVTLVRQRTRPRMKLCWNNSRRAVLHNDPERRLTYCDGMVFAVGFSHSWPMFHGWVLLDGAVPVDLTLRDTAAFHGVSLTRAEVLDALDGRRSYGVRLPD